MRVRGEVYFYEMKKYLDEKLNCQGAVRASSRLGRPGCEQGLRGQGSPAGALPQGLAGREWGRPEAWPPAASVGTGHVPAQLGPGGRARAGDRHPAALQGQG